MTIFSSVSVTLAPEIVKCLAQSETSVGPENPQLHSYLSNISHVYNVQCTIDFEGARDVKIEGSWASIQDVYMTLCSRIGHTVELVKSIIEAANTVDLSNLPHPTTKNLSFSHIYTGTTRETLEPTAFISEKPEVVTGVPTQNISSEVGNLSTDETVIEEPKAQARSVVQHSALPTEVKHEYANTDVTGHAKSEPKVEKEKYAKLFTTKLVKNGAEFTDSDHVAESQKLKSEEKERTSKRKANSASEPKGIVKRRRKTEISRGVQKGTSQATKPEEANSSTTVISSSGKTYMYNFGEDGRTIVVDVKDRDLENVDIKNEGTDRFCKDIVPEEMEDLENAEKTLMGQSVSKATRNNLKCVKCKFTAKLKLSLKEHIRRQHLPKLYRCVLCNREYGLHNDLMKHVRRVHIDAHICAICGKNLR